MNIYIPTLGRVDNQMRYGTLRNNSTYQLTTNISENAQ